MDSSSEKSFKLWDPVGTARNALAITALCTAFSFLGPYYWFFDLFCHWHCQYALICFITSAYYCWKKKSWSAALALTLLFLQISYLVPFYVTPSISHGGIKGFHQIKIAQINLCAQNKHTSSTVNYLKSKSFHILSFVEMTPTWLSALEEISLDYPYKINEPQDDCFGVALWSKKPIKDHRIVAYVSTSAPSIEATLVVNNQLVTVLVTHTLPPKSALLSNCRDEQLARIGERKELFHRDIILLGDLNNTPWSHSYKKLIQSLDLFDGRQGFGVCASWPTVATPLLIPIDHCLVSKRIKVEDFRLGPRVGSDHYPLEIVLGIPSANDISHKTN